MELQSNALVTLNDTKSFLRITNSESDDLLKMLINMATDFIEKRCERTFKQAVYSGATAELVSGSGENTIQLKNYPVTAISGIEENSNWDGGTASWVTLDSDEYFVAGEDFESGIIHRTFDFFTGQGNYRVSYTGGFATVPSDLQYACMMLVAQDFNGSGKSAGIKSESLGDHSITFESVLQEDSRVERIIRLYRRMTVL